MPEATVDLLPWGFALVAALYLGAFAALARPGAGGGNRWFLAALATTAAWGGLALFDLFWPYAASAYVTAAADLLRHGCWFGFLLQLLGAGRGGHPPAALKVLRPSALVIGALAVGALLWRIAEGGYEVDASRAAITGSVLLAVFGLLLVEQVFRNLSEDSRWNAKPVCLALAAVFAFDLYLWSEALLFARIDLDAYAVRPAVNALALPLLLVAPRRRRDWVGRLKVSRSAAFYSASLVIAGGYLLFMAAVGYYVRYFGGSWGRALQIALLVGALLGGAALLLSGALRARLRVFLGKHFFAYRYDHREEWLRFTAMLSQRGTPAELAQQVIRGLANVVESPAGSLWIRAGEATDHTQMARWNAAAQSEAEPADSPLSRFLRERAWVVDLAEWRRAPRRYGDLVLPGWLAAQPHAWLVVPLLIGDELLGFVVLDEPRAAIDLNWEVRDLLKTAARQAAGFLGQLLAAEALIESRKFDAFNRMSAFVVHDLKNIVTQLSLMLKNAQRLGDNREFQQDMLLTVESSLEKMRRLMLQLREGTPASVGARGVDLAAIVRKLQDGAVARGRSLEVEIVERVATRGHEDRLERVLGHLVQNALEATPPEGRVWVAVRRYSGQAECEIGDTGAGMTEDYVRNQLFKPFQTTKHSGMGIGTYECQQYLRELGGTIDVSSAPGRGTVMTLRMPLFDAGPATAADLLHSGS